MSAGTQISASLYQNFGADAIGIWELDSISGNVTKNSVTGKNDPVTPTGITTSINASNNSPALHFDGVSLGLVDIPNTPLLPRFTLSAWVYSESGGDARYSIIQSFWEIYDTNLCFWSYSFSHQYWRCTTTRPVQYNKWIHVATSWDGSVIRHYVDGKLVWQDTVTTIGSSQSFTAIAGYSGRRFKGSIDEVRIYSQTLGIAQINKIYAEGATTHTLAKRE
jgi:hypothetical protein